SRFRSSRSRLWLQPRTCPLFKRYIGVEPLPHGSKGRGREVALEQRPHARLKLAVASFAVTLPQADKNAKDARVALRGKRPICAPISLAPSRCRDIAIEHGRLDGRR